MDGLHRIVVSGRNSDISRTAFQDAAMKSKIEDGMELYAAYIHSRQAGECLLRAHTLRLRDKAASDFHHTEAMRELDRLAEALGLELVPRQDVVMR